MVLPIPVPVPLTMSRLTRITGAAG
jgi:hypothetical protein